MPFVTSKVWPTRHNMLHGRNWSNVNVFTNIVEKTLKTIYPWKQIVDQIILTIYTSLAGEDFIMSCPLFPGSVPQKDFFGFRYWKRNEIRFSILLLLTTSFNKFLTALCRFWNSRSKNIWCSKKSCLCFKKWNTVNIQHEWEAYSIIQIINLTLWHHDDVIRSFCRM